MSFVNVTGVFVVSAAYVNNGTARTTSAHTLRSLNFAICRAPPNWCSDLIVWFLILFAATWVKQELPTATMSYISSGRPRVDLFLQKGRRRSRPQESVGIGTGGQVIDVCSMLLV